MKHIPTLVTSGKILSILATQVGPNGPVPTGRSQRWSPQAPASKFVAAHGAAKQQHPSSGRWVAGDVLWLSAINMGISKMLKCDEMS